MILMVGQQLPCRWPSVAAFYSDEAGLDLHRLFGRKISHKHDKDNTD
jgi:hypothetical protein